MCRIFCDVRWRHPSLLNRLLPRWRPAGKPLDLEKEDLRKSQEAQ
jgi:hypothetical protein